MGRKLDRGTARTSWGSLSCQSRGGNRLTRSSSGLALERSHYPAVARPNPRSCPTSMGLSLHQEIGPGELPMQGEPRSLRNRGERQPSQEACSGGTRGELVFSLARVVRLGEATPRWVPAAWAEQAAARAAAQAVELVARVAAFLCAACMVAPAAFGRRVVSVLWVAVSSRF
jgi:hypothetical protein